MNVTTKVKVWVRLLVLAILIGLSVKIGLRHGITEGVVCFMVLGWLYDIRSSRP